MSQQPVTAAELAAAMPGRARWTAANGQEFQAAGSRIPEDGLPNGAILYFHTHGRRQWYGTCKMHRYPDCPHLVNWKPGSPMVGGATGGLAKTIMVEWRDDTPAASALCQNCEKRLARWRAQQEEKPCHAG